MRIPQKPPKWIEKLLNYLNLNERNFTTKGYVLARIIDKHWKNFLSENSPRITRRKKQKSAIPLEDNEIVEKLRENISNIPENMKKGIMESSGITPKKRNRSNTKELPIEENSSENEVDVEKSDDNITEEETNSDTDESQEKPIKKVIHESNEKASSNKKIAKIAKKKIEIIYEEFCDSMTNIPENFREQIVPSVYILYNTSHEALGTIQ